MSRSKKHSSHSKATASSSSGAQSSDAWISWAILGILLLVVFVLRMRLLDFPLERDEGAFAYMGRLLLDGIPPYTAAYDFKAPGLYVMYAVFIGLFGEKASAVHLGLLFLNLASMVLVFLLARRLLDGVAGLYAALVQGILSVSVSVLGFAAHATHFVVPLALAGALVLHRALESGRARDYLLSGSLLSLSFLMKQPAMFFVLFGFVAIFAHHGRNRPLQLWSLVRAVLWHGGGAAIPIVLTTGVLLVAGGLEQFWFWAFVYPGKYGSALPLAAGLQLFPGSLWGVVGGFFLVWLGALAGVLLVPFSKKLQGKRTFLVLFVLFSFLAVTPGYYFRQHYWVVFLPAVALLTGICFRFLQDLAGSWRIRALRLVPALLLIAFLAAGALKERAYLFDQDPRTMVRFIYGGNPFQESLLIAQVLESRTEKDDRIAILGSEPQIYFYAKRRSASPYIFTYPLVEGHEYSRSMQEEMIRDIEREEPKYLLFINIPTSWLARPESDPMIFTWFSQFAQDHYLLEGLVEILSVDRTDYYWDEAARSHVPTSSHYVTVFRRKDT